MQRRRAHGDGPEHCADSRARLLRCGAKLRMQDGTDAFSWYDVLEKIVAGLITSLIVATSGYLISRLTRDRLVKGVHKRAPIEEARWTVYLRKSPVAIGISSGLVILAFAVAVPSLVVGLSRGWQWYPAYGGVLAVLLLLNGAREFYASGLVFREAATQNMYELLEVLHDRVVDIISKHSVPTGFYRLVRCNIMLYNDKEQLLEMKYCINFDHNEVSDVDKGRSLPLQKGVAGRAFTWQTELVGIFKEIDRPTDKPDAWGFTPEDWAATREDLKWVWSVPLLREGEDLPLGVLNVDSNVEIDPPTHVLVGAVVVEMARVVTVACANLGQA